jgi:predicted Rossmann fold nucleotide-binding protein DprA/Smf involved in DNA uptake
LRPAQTASAAQAQQPDAPLREVLDVLSHDDALHIDIIASHLGRTSSTVAESLLQLELAGWIRALPGARFVRAK